MGGGGGGGARPPNVPTEEKKSCTCDLSARASASQTYIFPCVKILVISTYTFHQCSSPILLMVWRYITTIYQQNTNIEKIYVYASELENVQIFTFKNWYFFQYFVGTSNTLSVQMTCLSAYTYRQISKCIYRKTPKKHYGGGGGSPPPPPSGYASDNIQKNLMQHLYKI